MSIHGYSYWTRREPLVPREQMWANEEAKSIDERRRRYRCRDRFVTLENIPSWPIYRQGIAQRLRQERREKIEAARRWIAQQREAYRRRCAQHEAKRQRLEAARERKAARQARRQAKLEQKQQQQKQVEQEAEANKKNVEQEEEDEASKQQVEQAKVEDEKNVEQEGGEVVEKKAEEEPVEEEEKKEDSDDDGDEDDDDDVDDDDDDEDDDEDATSSDEESELSSSEEEPVFAELPDPDADEEVEEQAPPPTAHFAPDEEINRIVTMWRGDITHLEIDAIVNAANRSMLGGGGIDGAIHRAAGDDLYNECKQLNGCATGHCKITRGYWLPAKYVIHTVGPIGENPVALRSCYLNCLRVAVANGVRSLAFCGISTGIYGYPLYEASHIALKTVRRWLEEGDNRTKFDSIIFCVFLDKERLCYEQLIPLYFPLPGAPYELLPMQPGEEREVPPMVEGKDLSSYSDSDSDSDDDDDDDSDDSDDEGEAEKGKGKKTAKGAAPVAPPPIPNADADANAANVDAAADADAANGDAEAEVSELASGVEALAIAPSAAPAEDQTAAAAAPAANDANNDATSTTSTASTGSDDASTDATPAQ